MGRPITSDKLTWYAPAHRIDHGTAVLLRSTDGVNWTIHSTIFEGKEERADETAIQFLQDGRIVAATRLEAGSSLFGSQQAGTLISVAASPFTAWTQITKSHVTRLDGPTLFGIGNQVFAVGRRQTRIAGPFQWMGSAISQKRTALFLVKENAEGLIHLTDLPSSGDTSYAGVAIVGRKGFHQLLHQSPTHRLPLAFGNATADAYPNGRN